MLVVEPLVELGPKLGVVAKPEPNTLLVELPDLNSDVPTAEPRPKLGANEPEGELPEVPEENLKSVACETAVDVCVFTWKLVPLNKDP